MNDRRWNSMAGLLLIVLLGSGGLIGCGDRGGELASGADEMERPTTSATDHADAGAADDHDVLPLRIIMQRLGAEMSGLTHALWVEDLEAIERHASAIADHAHMSPEEVARIQRVLGAEMPEFEELDEAVHLASVRLHAAAEGRRLDELVDALADVQQGCVACHTRFRDRLTMAQ